MNSMTGNSPQPPLDNGCPRLPQFKKLLVGDLAEEQFLEIEDHISRCSSCEDLLNDIDDILDPLIAHFKEAVGSSFEIFDDQIEVGEGVNAVGNPERLGDFRILREIGRGGMGIVYEAEQISLGRRVALKVLPFTAVLDPLQLQRFETEAMAAASLEHDHIVPVFQVGCDRAVHFYAMRLIDGRDVSELIGQLRKLLNNEGEPCSAGTQADFELASRLADGDFQPSENGASHDDRASEIVRETVVGSNRSTKEQTRQPAYFRTIANLGIQAAEALDFAHRHDVIHRDIKPSNLMLDSRGKLWVTDFGLARIDSELGLTNTGDVMGTLRYMSPEQSSGDPALVDGRSDIYSLGATLYELLTLQPIYCVSNRLALIKLREEEDPIPPRQINRAIPPALDAIVIKALSRDPEQRYATGQELADDLKRFLKAEETVAKPQSAAKRIKKWFWRQRGLLRTAALVVLLSGIVIIIRDKYGNETKIVPPNDSEVTVKPQKGTGQSDPQQQSSSPVPQPAPTVLPAQPAGPPMFAASGQTLGKFDSTDLAMGDFNEDGRLDVVIANGDGNPSYVWLGRGDGMFQPQPLPIDENKSYTRGIAVGDLNGDKHLDLFFSNMGEANSVWLGKGDGNFIAGQNNLAVEQLDVTDTRGWRVELQDLNTDGHLDAVVAAEEYSQVWLGQGDGTFRSGAVLNGKHARTRQIALGDFNGDKILDAFEANSEPVDRILRGIGDGYFVLDQPLKKFKPMITHGVALGDLNGDQRLDIVIAGSVPTQNSVWLANEKGEITESLLLGKFPVTGEAVKLGDLDADGDLDIVFANGKAQGPGDNHVWLGDGRGGFQFAQSLGDSYSVGVALGDLDGDGDLDAVFANGTEPNTVWLNQAKQPQPKVILTKPQGNLIFVQGPQSLGNAESLGIATGDLNEDGHIDIAVANSSQYSNCVWIGKGDGTFHEKSLSFGGKKTMSMDVAVGDLNGDKHLDLFIARRDGPNTIWLGDGKGTFLAGQETIDEDSSNSVTLADIDGDGDLDAAVANQQFSKIWLGSGDGTFREGMTLDDEFAHAMRFVLADFNGNGVPDLYLANYQRGNRVLLGVGNGYFLQDSQIHSYSRRTSDAAVGDFNGDGRPDVVLACVASHHNSVWFATGEGKFREHTRLGEHPVQGEAVAVADLDGDGHLDIVIANGAAHGPPENHVWRGDGLGGFQFVQTFGNSYSRDLALADLDGDGDLDAVVANSENEKGLPNTVWLNQTNSPEQ